MATYFVSFSWGICILLAFVGWGGLINRILFPKHQIDWGQRAAWGIAFSILVGGLLNATSSISRTTVFIYVGSGAVFWFTDLFIRKLSLKSSLCLSTVALAKDPPLLVGTLIVLFLAILDYAGSVFTQLRWVGINGPVFNSVDDLQAYFVYPIKMLQTGSMGQDPFNEKRFTFFGGQSFLDAFVLSALSEKSLKMMDAGIGVLIIIGLLIGYFVERGTPPRRAVCVLLFLLLIPSPGINISSLMIGTA